MTKPKALMGAVVLAGGLTAVSFAAFAAAIPSSFVTGTDPHQVGIALMKQTVEQLGFTGVRNIRKDGRIFDVEAKWEGETINQRIDARNSSIESSDAN